MGSVGLRVLQALFLAALFHISNLKANPVITLTREEKENKTARVLLSVRTREGFIYAKAKFPKDPNQIAPDKNSNP